MTTQIFICNHVVPSRTVKNALFSTLVSGHHSSPSDNYEGDLDGVNIAAENTHSELRHQYFVWKNKLAGLDYVGFEHYRRAFLIDPLPAEQVRKSYPRVFEWRRQLAAKTSQAEIYVGKDQFCEYLEMRDSFDADVYSRVDDWISSFDVITTRPRFEGIEAQWLSMTMAELWPHLVDSVKHNRYFENQPNYIRFDLIGSYCNMYIMKSNLFAEYMQFWTAAVERLEVNLGKPNRLLGHFAERLFSCFLYQKRIENPLLRVHYLPYLVCNDKIDEI